MTACIHGESCLTCRAQARKKRLIEQQDALNALPLKERQEIVEASAELHQKQAEILSAFTGAMHAETFIRGLTTQDKRALIRKIEGMIQDGN